MPATTNTISIGRITPYATLAAIEVTFTGTATYSSASGGFPVDLTQALILGSPQPEVNLNPGDVIGLSQSGLTVGGYLPVNLTLNPASATYVNKTTYGGSLRPDTILSTCPAFVRLMGVGASAANHAGFGEPADGALTDTFTIMILVARGGKNNQ